MRSVLEVFIKMLPRNLPIEVDFRGKRLFLPASHRLPIYLADHPRYDELPIRLAQFLRNKYGNLGLIDVGANVGDTITACFADQNDRFLAIEPDRQFLTFLRKNCGKFPNCQILEILCSSSNGSSQFQIQEKKGTAVIRKSHDGIILEQWTLDTIINNYPNYANSNFLKIDTDGHDFQVLQGGRKWISRTLPAVFFECDIFDNESYVEQLLDSIRLFLGAGYSKAIVYDNFGYIFCVLDLPQIASFKYPILYQLTSEFYYFDILVMKDDDISSFLELEMKYFIDNIPDKAARRAATLAAGL